MMANQIIAHDEMVKNIRANLSFFGNPTLLSSRPKQDIVEHDASDPAQRPSISSQSGFQSEFFLIKLDLQARQCNSRVSWLHRKAWIGHESSACYCQPRATDRVGFITPNAVSTDQARFAEQLRSEIRLPLVVLTTSVLPTSPPLNTSRHTVALVPQLRRSALQLTPMAFAAVSS